ncbi:uncharacterized protein [Typha latifolia]|uniref:uncharacterized protein isoform X3 n=1 Tax=Typha latifolia TaxID=4733 RepID=UPI003C2BDB7E
MEQKHLLMSAFGVGIGVGVGLGVGKWAAPMSATGVTEENVEAELMRQVMDGRDSKVTFDEFPYYLSEQTRVVLTSAAYVHLKQADLSKYIRNLSPASRAILLSGPAELYQQMLAKALSHYFESKLLLLDLMDFSLKIQSKYGISNKDSVRLVLHFHKRSVSETTLEKVSGLLGSLSIIPKREEPKGINAGLIRRQSSSMELRPRCSDCASSGSMLRKNASVSSDMSDLSSQCGGNPVPLRRTSSWSFDEHIFIKSLYKVLVRVSRSNPVVLYIRDVEDFMQRSKRMPVLFQKMLNRLSGPVLVLGSRLVESDSDYRDVDRMLSSLFTYNIEIKPPEDETHLVSWKSQLEEDMKMIQIQDNRNHITEVLAANDLDCDDLGSICLSDAMVLSNYIEEIIISAVSYHLMNNKDPDYRNGKLIISSKSLSHGLSIFQESSLGGKDTLKLETNAESGKEVAPDNEFEKRIRPEVIPASEIGVTFDDIGALDDIKESLQELVMLPLRRPDLFKGGLLKPCRGILLFGPPGTGKTMLAKAIANEAGASFINVSMSTITSKWFGEDEKNVRALFTLAAKVAPTIIFVDEVDSMLGQRTRVGEHEAMRKIKNEFMSHWDGLLTKCGERILVLAATNRPFDLDEAIIRRFERRIMVGLPTLESRESILRTLLSKEDVEGELDYKELATMTEGYSGSDLKNLCVTAAYRPVRELIQKERQKELERRQNAEKREIAGEASQSSEVGNEQKITLRPLNMEDLRQAKNQVAASFATEGCVMNELKQWNDLYGEGGSRKKQQLSYFL